MKGSAYFIARNGCLVPADDEAVRTVAEVAKRNRGALVHIHVPRNIRQHRLYWALMHKICDAGAWDGPPKTLSDWVKIKIGHVTTGVNLTRGEMIVSPKSIGFAAMPQNDFNEFFQKAIQVICERLLDNANADELRRQIETSLDRGYEAMRREYA